MAEKKSPDPFSLPPGFKSRGRSLGLLCGSLIPAKEKASSLGRLTRFSPLLIVPSKKRGLLFAGPMLPLLGNGRWLAERISFPSTDQSSGVWRGARTSTGPRLSDAGNSTRFRRVFAMTSVLRLPEH